MMKRLIHWIHVTIIALFGMMLFMSCNNRDNSDSPQEYVGMPLIILDTDIGSSTDDLFALEMLYRYEEQGLCQLLGVVVDREGEQNAVFTDVMNTYFGHGNVPIGLVREGIDNPKVWIDYAHVADMQDGHGQPMFRRTVTNYSALPDGWQLYRQLLATQPDHSVSIVCTGFVTCLAQLLQSEGDEYSSLNGVELVRRKVKCIYMQGGVFGEAEEPDFNFAQGADFAQEFFSRWPTDVGIHARTSHRRCIMDGRAPYQTSVYDLQLQHGPAHVGCDANRSGCRGRSSFHALRTRHPDRHPRMCHHLYPLSYGTFSLPDSGRLRLVCRHAGKNQNIQYNTLTPQQRGRDVFSFTNVKK